MPLIERARADFTKATNRGPTKAGCIKCPTRLRSISCSSEERVDIGCVPGMNGSALRISQSVRDAAHITITIPQTCLFLNCTCKDHEFSYPLRR